MLVCYHQHLSVQHFKELHMTTNPTSIFKFSMFDSLNKCPPKNRKTLQNQTEKRKGNHVNSRVAQLKIETNQWNIFHSTYIWRKRI